MIEVPESGVTPIFFAEPGQDSQVSSVAEVLETPTKPRAPWSHLCVAENLTVTIRSGLYVLVYEGADGSWSGLQELGANVLFAVALATIKEDHLVINVGPASIDFMQVRVAGDRFNGRLDIGLLGEMRVVGR